MLSSLIVSRNVFYKHRDGCFHSAFPYVLSVTIVDIPMILIECFVFVTPLYWMSGSIPLTPPPPLPPFPPPLTPCLI